MLTFLERSQWRSTAPLGPPMRLPALGVTFHQSVTRATSSVAADMRLLESIGVQRFGRFSYCYAIHPTGVVGVGAGLTVGAHTAGHNSTRVGVVFIKMDNDPLSPAAEQAAVELLRYLANGALIDGYTVDGHRDYKATACPSEAVYGRLSAIHAAALTSPPKPPTNPPGDDMTPEQLAAIVAATERTLPFAVRLTADHGTYHKGEVVVLDPGTGTAWRPGRATLNALYFVGAIRHDDGNNPPPGNPTDWAGFLT